MGKIYRGKDGVVIVEDDVGGRAALAGGPFEWGAQTLQCAALARALLVDLLGEGMRPTKLYRRFMHRSVSLWQKNAPWVASEEELLSIVREIESVEKELAGARAQMARDRPQLLIDAPAPGMTWDKDPDIVPNKPKERKNA